MLKKEKKGKRLPPEAIVREISELLSKNGYVILTIPTPTNLLGKVFGKFIKVKVSLKIVPKEIVKKK